MIDPDELQEDDADQLLLQRMVFKHYAMNFLAMNWKFIAALAAIAILMVFLFLYDFKPDKIASSETETQTAEPTAVESNEPSITSKLDRFYELCQLSHSLGDASRLKTALDLASEIETSNTLTDEEIIGLKSAKLNTMRSLCKLGRKFNLAETATADADFEAYLASLIEEEALGLSAQAHVALSLNKVTRYLINPTHELLEEIKQQASVSVPTLLKSRKQLEFLTVALKELARDTSEFKSQTFQFLDELGTQYKSAGTEQDLQYGSIIHDQLVMRGRDIDELCFLASINDASGIEELQELVSEIASAKQRSKILYRFAIKAIEKLSQYGHGEHSEAMMQQINQSVDSISPDSLKAQVKEMIFDYDTRSNLVAKKIDLSVLSGVDDRFSVDEKFQGKPVVIFFCDVSPRSSSAARSITSLRNSSLDVQRFEFLIVTLPVYVDELAWGILSEPVNKHLKREQEFESLLLTQPTLAKTFIVPSAKADLLRDQIPVLNAPYILVLDSEHEVHATNLVADKLGNVLKKLE